jgi:hypothetical protein
MLLKRRRAPLYEEGRAGRNQALVIDNEVLMIALDKT